MAKWTRRNHDRAFDAFIEKALTKIGIIIEGQAVDLAPIKTGRLKGSITYATRKNKSNVRGKARPSDVIRRPSDEHELWVGTNVEYAEAIEYGHRRKTSRKSALASLAGRVASQGFLRPALDMNRKNAAKILREELKREYGKR